MELLTHIVEDRGGCNKSRNRYFLFCCIYVYDTENRTDRPWQQILSGKKQRKVCEKNKFFLKIFKFGISMWVFRHTTSSLFKSPTTQRRMKSVEKSECVDKEGKTTRMISCKHIGLVRN